MTVIEWTQKLDAMLRKANAARTEEQREHYMEQWKEIARKGPSCNG